MQALAEHRRGEATSQCTHEASTSLAAKPDQNSTKQRKPQTKIPPKYKHKDPIQQHIKRIVDHNQVEFIPGTQGGFSVQESIHITHPINRLEKKEHTIIANEAEKASDKIQIPVMRFILRKRLTARSFLNVIDNIHTPTCPTSPGARHKGPLTTASPHEHWGS